MANPVRQLLGLEERGLSYSDIWNRGLDVFGTYSRTAAGKHVDTNSALGLTTAYACVRILNDTVSTIPVGSHVRGADDVRRHYPRPKWLEFRTGPYRKTQLFGEIMTSLATSGNAYIATYRAADASILFLEVLDPAAVTPIQDEKTREIFYEVRTPHTTNTLTRFDILHLRGLTLPGELEALSPIQACRESIALGLAAQEFGAAFFGNGALPGMVVEADGTISETGIAAMKAAWNEVHRGAGNAHRLAVFTEGAKLSKITIPPEDAQFLQTRGFQVNDTARIWGVPTNLLQHSDGPEMGQSLSDKNTHFVQHTIRPWIERIEEGLTWLMLSEGAPPEVFVKFNLNELMRGDFETRFSTYSVAVTQGILTINEVRDFEDMPPVEWGDEPVSVQVQEDVGDDEDDEEDNPPPPPAPEEDTDDEV